MIELEPDDLADPGRLLRDVRKLHDIKAGDALLALVRDASGEQTLRRVRRVRLPDAIDGREPSDYLFREVTRLRVPAGRPPRHSIVTITARCGFAVFGRDEMPWYPAWRYANVHVDAYISNHVLVTEHGWFDFMSGLGGDEPALDSRGAGERP